MTTDRGVLSSAEASRAPEGRLYAVAIGIDDYSAWPALSNAANDATGLLRLMAGTLGAETPFPAILNQEATRARIQALVKDDLKPLLEGPDSLVFFFAGHGHTRIDRVGDREVATGYVVPVDGGAEAGGEWASYIQIDHMLDDLAKLPARHVLVVLDSCHSGFALGNSVTKYRGAERYTATLASHVSRRVLSSARHDELALDGGPIPGHSLFTGTLIHGLETGVADRDNNGVVTASELSLFVQQEVGQASDSRQTPDFGSFGLDERGELVFWTDPFKRPRLPAESGLGDAAPVRRGEVESSDDQVTSAQKVILGIIGAVIVIVVFLLAQMGS